MNVEHLKTVLRVMNMTAPFDQVWCAQSSDSGSFAREVFDIQDSYRFYLVPDDSALLGEKGVITA
jgi:hypothetical protein